MIYVDQIFIEFIIIFYYKLCRLDVDLYWPARTLCEHFWTTVTDIYMGDEGREKQKTCLVQRAICVSLCRHVTTGPENGGGEHNAQLNFDVSHCTTHNRSLSCSPQELKLRACAVFALKADLDSCALLARDNLCTYMSHSSKNTV